MQKGKINWEIALVTTLAKMKPDFFFQERHYFQVPTPHLCKNVWYHKQKIFICQYYESIYISDASSVLSVLFECHNFLHKSSTLTQ